MFPGLDSCLCGMKHLKFLNDEVEVYWLRKYVFILFCKIFVRDWKVLFIANKEVYLKLIAGLRTYV